MNQKTNYGKIVAITVAIIASASSIAFVVYRLCRNLITFCNSYTHPEEEPCEIDLCEIDEDCLEDTPEEIVVELPEGAAADAE